MQQVENSVWNLDINGKPALNALGELEKKLYETKEAQKELTRGTKEWAESKQDIKALEEEIKQVRETMGQAGMTVRQLEGYARQLGKEIKDLTPGTDDYIKKTEELQQVNTRLASVRSDVRAVAEEGEKTQGTWGRIKEWIIGAFVVTAIYEAGQMIMRFVGEAVENFTKYDAAAKELSANTNIIGSELELLKTKAKELGPEVGKTADEMLAAYQMMGSAKSDLTENAEALAAVTKEAIILSQAGKIELAPATELMAGALNQFNAPASDAGRFINAIAAGAQVGSAEIVDMTGALKASGTVANAANVSFEETNGALQSLSTINIKGEQAGTMFRNMLIKLMSSTEDLNPQVVGLEKSLDNLAAQNLTTAELAKMFGTENVVAAQHLMTHRGQVVEFTEALTGTDAAYKMAAVNNETLEFKQKQLDVAFGNSALKLGEILAPALNLFYDTMLETGIPALEAVIQAVVAFGKALIAIPEFISENRAAFIALGVALVSLNTANIAAAASTIALAAAEKGRLIWTEAGTVAQWALNTAMSANPIGAVVAAVALLVGGFITLYNNSETVRGVITGVWEALKTGIQVIVDVAQAVGKGFSELLDKLPFVSAGFTLVGEIGKLVFNGLIELLGWVGEKVVAATEFFGGLYTRVSSVGQSIGQAMQPAFDFITGGFGIVKQSINNFFDWIQTNVSKVTSFLKSITPDGFIEAGKVFSDAGKKISKSFQDAFVSEQVEGQKKQTTLNTQKHAEDAARVKKAAEDESKTQTGENLKAINSKAADNAKMRAEDIARAKAAAEKAAAEKTAANATANKAIEQMLIAAITDETARKKAQLAFELNEKLAANAKSKADDLTKVNYEIALRAKFKADTEKLEEDARTKKALEEQKKLTEMAKLEEQLRTERLTREYATTKAVLEYALTNEKLTILDRQKLKLDLIELERQHTFDRIDQTAAKERAKAIETSTQLMKLAGDDDVKKRQIAADLDATTRSIDAKLLADKNLANEKYNAESMASTEKVLKHALENETLTTAQKQKLKLDLIELVRTNEINRIELTAKNERDTAIATSLQLMKMAGDDDVKKRQIAADLDATTRQIDAKLLADKNAANEKYNAESKAATKAVLEQALKDETLTTNQRQKLKLDLIALEHQMEIERIERTAELERQRARETSAQLMALAGDDDAKKREIKNNLDATIRQIDAKLITDTEAANNAHLARTTDAMRKATAERLENQNSFFDAIKSLLKGDFDLFSNYVTQKLKNEKAMNDERLQNWTGKAQEILNIVKGSLEIMMGLNEAYLTSQINRNNKERDDKIKKLQQQYQKGLIDKATYESGVEGINQQADAKEKDLKMKAWKRDQAGQIAMAIVNAAAAALKSLATMGWPLGLVGVAGAAAAAAIQIGMIKRQQPPSFAQGGKIQNAGVPDGPRHGSSYGRSGIALVDRETGEEKGEMEGGEPIMILSRNTYKNNGKVIDKLLYSSLHRNGAPVFAENGTMMGDYQDFIEPIQAGQMYLFGSKKRKAYDKKMQEQYDADQAAKAELESYMNYDYSDMGGSDGGDYGGDYGGEYDTNLDFGEGSYDESGYNGNDYPDGSEGASIDGVTNAQIQKSQSMMDSIAKNTHLTVQAITALNNTTKDMAGKIDQLINATNRAANGSESAAQAGWQAAAAGNRAADAASMGGKNNL
ncbi:phage tail tape measure protein [Arundinibacter roseus]|nr:phage tail tape measure protein [Arundinibacter roseus]